MLDPGQYVLLRTGFSKDKEPTLTLQRNEDIYHFELKGQSITLTFENTRLCTGWHDLRTGELFICPTRSTISNKYDQCSACQARTGFNPAFYNTDNISSQQTERNLQPHSLYLAHFGGNVIKVGISHHKRRMTRLLEQGARSAYLLGTFPTAYLAREYEAYIAALPTIVETVQLRKKITLLKEEFDHGAAEEQLKAKKDFIEKEMGESFDESRLLSFDKTYFPNAIPNLAQAIDVSSQRQISGTFIGLIGSLLFCKLQDETIFLPLKNLTGYTFSFTNAETKLSLPMQQTSLF